MDASPALTTALADRYRIERELGQGGMALVYLAQDVRHDRRVAIKVLRPELAAIIGAERFLREIKTIANLQHPHILGLIDSGEVNGTAYYVMPYVEGESLRDRLNRERLLPITDAVRLATEIASALDYAHRHHVIHRDIKPENILLHDGRALVADFGIALAVSSAGGTRMTETGMSLGTPHYMSPEQAMGEREITARSDVYALGCVLYEMLVGEPPFTGPTAQAVVAKVVTEQPRELIPKRHTIPPYVEEAVLTALEKTPADRFATAAEFASALTTDSGTGSRRRTGMIAGQRPGAPSRPRSRLTRAAVLSAAAAALLLLGVLAGKAVSRRDGDTAGFALQIVPEAEHHLDLAFARNVGISPDGATVAFIGRGNGGLQVFVRRFDSFTVTAVPGTEGADLGPVFSPDGKALAYVADGGSTLYRVSLSGGQTVRVSTNIACCTLEWRPQGLVISTFRGLEVIPPSGGTGRVVGALGFPGVATMLPDGSVIALSDVGGRHAERLNERTGKWEPVEGLPDGIDDIMYADGQLLIQVGTTLNAVPFDVKRGRVDGELIQLQTGVRLGVSGGYRQSQSALGGGTLIYVPAAGTNHLTLVNRGGREEILTDTSGIFHRPRFSPDGSKLTVDITREAGRDVWIYDLDQRTLSRLSFERNGHDAIWAPDGKSVVYAAAGDRDTLIALFTRRIDGSTELDTISTSPGLAAPEAVTLNGSEVLAYASDSTTGADAWLVPRKGKPQPVLNTQFQETDLALSRDGHWLAWASNESGREEIYVRRLEGGVRLQVSTAGGSEAVWGADARELFYRAPGSDGHLMAAKLSLDPVRVTARDTVFGVTKYEESDPHANYDYDPHGDRFIFLRAEMPNEIRVVRNWRALLEKR
jgi:Tol biopolymer transport system component/tRNA A-37 threonylcarbamoyl transferase component Bud32